MLTVSQLFNTSRYPTSAVIPACTWSSWPHVELIDGDEVFEATGPAGVNSIPVMQVIHDATPEKIVDLPCRDPQVAIPAVSLLSKPYDYTAVLGFGLRREWREDDAWFCSELVALAFAQAGESLFRAEVVH